MLKKYSKSLIAVLLVVEFCFMYLSIQSYLNKDVEELAKVNEVDNKTFAMFIENDEGNYEETTDTSAFPEGYILNLEMTSCIDNKGNTIEDILTSKDDKVMVKSNKTIFCYLYFDKDNRVFAQVKRDYKNSNGVLLLSETESDEYPVYYYSGNITNNNILYANFCWKMVRTTETGGVKLIYNGVPDEAEDGTLTCDNTGEESQIGKSNFNGSIDSPAYVGYMYNTAYKTTSFDVKVSRGLEDGIFLTSSYNPKYYFADTITWDGSKYILSNSDGSAVMTYTWLENYSDLKGYYTCLSATQCETVRYTTRHYGWGNGIWMYFYVLSDGKYLNDYKIKFASSVTDNEDGTYTLVEPIEVTYTDYAENYSNYINYYVCWDLTSETCSNMTYFISTSSNGGTGYNRSPYKYGNSFTYENGVYKLVDTKEFWNWSENYNSLNNNHYTCFNTTGECTTISYIYYATNTLAYRITLSDGKTVEDAINEMLYADDVNKIDSIIKDKIDTWYETNIVDVLDSNSILYSSYLENTIFCNNRATTNLSVSGWNPNGGSTSKILFFNYNSLECNNKTDRFTLKVEAGGTEGYGNNALDYPVGLLNNKEVELATIEGFLNIGVDYWQMSPGSYHFQMPYYARNIASGGNHVTVWNSYGVRPSISLSNKVEITSGAGSVTTPYKIILPS